jgi:hypothetical protein
LLDWLDTSVEPVAFNDEPDHIGVAVIAPDLRLVVQRNGVLVSSGPSGADLEYLGPALQGVFDVLKPKAAVVTMAHTMCTQEIVGQAYDEARARFARHLTVASPTVAGYRTTDASCLADFDGEDVEAQVEWGVVERSELFFRLANPAAGRLATVAPRHGADTQADLGSLWGDDAPEVALLVDVAHQRKVGGRVANAEDVLARGAHLDLAAVSITEALHEGLWPGREYGRELA